MSKLQATTVLIFFFFFSSSNTASPPSALRCHELGVAAYLTKPVRQGELLDAILTALGANPRKQDRPALVTRHSLREDGHHLKILLVEDIP